MLYILNDAQAPPVDFDGYFICQKYDGIDELWLELPVGHPDYPLFTEEITVEDREVDGTIRYTVKAIDEGGGYATIRCEIDLDELRADMRLAYDSGSLTPAEHVAAVLPAGWTVQDHALITTRRTLHLEAATPMGIIRECLDTFGITARYDNHNKVVHLYNPAENKPTGALITDELNLRAVDYKGTSADFATRMYAFGKDGMTFADINDGKPYVDDHTYSDKVISVYWKDERYEIPENLLADTRRNLAAMAVPQRSYECDVVDLARADPEHYAVYGVKMYDVVTMLDRRRNKRIDHMVVEYVIYPHDANKNVVTLSTVAPSVQHTIKQLQQQVETPTSSWRQMLQASIDTATQLIAGMLGGNFVITTSEDGKPNGWAILDTQSPETSKNVWRATLGGIGHSSNGFNGPFDLALTMDGKINASMIATGILDAALIKAGVLQSVDGSTKLNLENGRFETVDGAYALKFWGGVLELLKNNKQTIHIYSSGADTGYHGVINIYNADGHVVSALAGGDVRGRNYYLRLNDRDVLLATIADNGATSLAAQNVQAQNINTTGAKADTVTATTFAFANGSASIPFAQITSSKNKRITADEIIANAFHMTDANENEYMFAYLDNSDRVGLAVDLLNGYEVEYVYDSALGRYVLCRK